MSKDAKQEKPTAKPVKRSARRGGSTFLGILIGLILGLVLALGVAWYINKLPNPFSAKPPAPPAKAELPVAKGPATKAVPLVPAPAAPKAAPEPAPPAPAAPTETAEAEPPPPAPVAKPKPPAEPKAEPKAERAEVAEKAPPKEREREKEREKEKEKPSTDKPREAFYLQAGAFQNASDADTQKARVAMLGFEAVIQQRTIPDKGVWHRVRIGPYSNVDEVNQVRGVLRQNDIDTVLVKVREPAK